MPQPYGGKLIDRVLSGERLHQVMDELPGLPQVSVTEETAVEIQNIAHGVFGPLEGFLSRGDYLSVVNEMRLSDDTPWTIPIVLDISAEEGLREGQRISLVCGSKPVAVMQVEELYPYDKEEFAQKVFGTLDAKHPGVAKVQGMKERLAGGKIELIAEVDSAFARYYLKPAETRFLFQERGWQTVVGFQTRNVPHLGHEYVQKTALAFCDGLFINPVIGKKKRGDFRDGVILSTCQALIQHYYPKDRAVMSILPFEMRYAGPREAICHAIIRKNFGCSHFIVGRDHAGVGNYYPPYAAQEIFAEFTDLGITPLFFSSFFYCRKCLGVMSEKTCPHGQEDHIDYSGTRMRELLLRGEAPPKELMRPEVTQIILDHPHPYVE